MKFNEKLIELRKKAGLSQEELGYKLNVTRQTVSKWELGQTTPEMDKLVEISKVFGVTVDELISEAESNINAEKIEDKAINENPQNNSTCKVILLIVAVFIIGIIIFYAFIFPKISNKFKGIYNSAEGIIDATISGINQSIDSAQNQYNDIKDGASNITEDIEEQKNDYEEAKNYVKEEGKKLSEQADSMLEDMKKQQEEIREQNKKIQEQVKAQQEAINN